MTTKKILPPDGQLPSDVKDCHYLRGLMAEISAGCYHRSSMGTGTVFFGDRWSVLVPPKVDQHCVDELAEGGFTLEENYTIPTCLDGNADQPLRVVPLRLTERGRRLLDRLCEVPPTRRAADAGVYYFGD